MENKKFLNYIQTITKVNLYTKKEYLIYFNANEDKKIKFFPCDLKTKTENLINWSKNNEKKIEAFDEIKIIERKVNLNNQEKTEIRKARYYTNYRECKNCKNILNENNECQCTRRCHYCLSTEHSKSNCDKKNNNNKKKNFYDKNQKKKSNHNKNKNCNKDYVFNTNKNYCLANDESNNKSNSYKEIDNDKNLIFFDKNENCEKNYCLYCLEETHLNCYYDYQKFNFGNNFIGKKTFFKLFDDFKMNKNIDYYFLEDGTKKIHFNPNYRIIYNDNKFAKTDFLNFCVNELKIGLLRRCLSNKSNKIWKNLLKKIIKFYEMKLDKEIENLNEKKKISEKKKIKKKQNYTEKCNKKQRKNRQLKKYLNSDKFISEEINSNNKNGKYKIKKNHIKMDEEYFLNKFEEKKNSKIDDYINLTKKDNFNNSKIEQNFNLTIIDNNINSKMKQKKLNLKKKDDKNERKKKKKREKRKQRNKQKKIEDKLFEMKFDYIKNFENLDKCDKKFIEDKISKKINIEINKILKENEITEKEIELNLNFEIPKKKINKKKKDKNIYSKQNDHKIKIKYYKNLKNLSYRSLNNLLKKKCSKNSNKRIFDQVHENSNQIIFCVYSGELLSKKGKMIQPYNKEHLMPKFSRNRDYKVKKNDNFHFKEVEICRNKNFNENSKKVNNLENKEDEICRNKNLNDNSKKVYNLENKEDEICRNKNLNDNSKREDIFLNKEIPKICQNINIHLNCEKNENQNNLELEKNNQTKDLQKNNRKIENLDNKQKEKLSEKKKINKNSKKYDHFENNLHNIVPVCEEANFLRGSKFFFCPTFEKSKNKCNCDSLKLSKNLLGLGREAILIEDFYSQVIEECLDSFVNKKKEKILNFKLFEKNEFGYFFLGEPGFFCPKYNIGPISRACLYSLVKYPGGFNFKKKNKKFLDYIIYKAEFERVEDWEKIKNFKVFLYQRERNPFIYYPSWSSKINFDKAFK